MRRIKYAIDLGYCGIGEEDEMDVDDNASDSDIDQMVNDMAIEAANSWEGDERLMSAEEWEDGGSEHFYENACGSWEFVEAEQ